MISKEKRKKIMVIALKISQIKANNYDDTREQHGSGEDILLKMNFLFTEEKFIFLDFSLRVSVIFLYPNTRKF